MTEENKLRDDYLLFLDLETTGVDPAKDLVLEVGAILVESKSLERMWQGTDYILCNDEDVEALLSPFVREMHTKSGLLAGLGTEVSNYLEPSLSNYLHQIRDVLGTPYKEFYGEPWIRLAGYSPQFDRQFILRDAPAFAQLLSHRMMDVSSLRAAAKVWAPQLVKEQEAEHRALADCVAAIEELKVYRTVFGTTDVRLP